jgi:hypothetical protein
MRDVFDGLLVEQDGRVEFLGTGRRDNRLVAVQRVEGLGIRICHIAQISAAAVIRYRDRTGAITKLVRKHGAL